jgi:hypothetical protein
VAIQLRHYSGLDDYNHAAAFLIEHHQPNNADGNSLEA